MDLAPGDRLGRYEVVSPLASGGMGRVYRARDVRLAREVAIKVLSHADPDLLARFEREARAMAVLSHPNIVTIFDVGTHEGAPFLVSELLDGRTLRAALESGPMPVARACAIALQLARGVAAAHALRIALEPLLREAPWTASSHPVPATPARAAPAPAGSLPPSVAVLPFADMSPTRDQEWLCEGMAEELIDALTQIEGLRVAARSSSFQFRARGVDLQAVGARLGVASVLEGSVRKVGDRLRVTVQLVGVEDGYHRWSRRFDRTPADVFDIQDEIAQNVVSALRGILTPGERAALRRPETSAECYEYFLRGRQLIHRFDRVALETARPMFERAIEIDPAYAPAHAGLADVYSWFYEWWGGGEADLAAADRASQRALQLAPELAESNSSRGFVLSLRRRYEEAARAFEDAIRLNPNSFDAHYLYARTCFACGQIERSAELFRRAGEVRLEDFQSMVLLAQSLRVLGRVDEADEANREAVRRVERRVDLDPTDARALSLGAHALDDDGQRERALGWTGKALELHPNDQGVLVNGACLFARAGRADEALELLERTFARGFGKRDWIEHDPDYDSLRDHPRFKAMLSKLR